MSLIDWTHSFPNSGAVYAVNNGGRIRNPGETPFVHLLIILLIFTNNEYDLKVDVSQLVRVNT